mmetsp:Transcript_2316/g.3997  ORF Transcript_2316/g.3997 Transcript_2316/m.3997 type:complete len:117 (-) Transcript_2316:27-377(-)
MSRCLSTRPKTNRKRIAIVEVAILIRVFGFLNKRHHGPPPSSTKPPPAAAPPTSPRHTYRIPSHAATAYALPLLLPPLPSSSKSHLIFIPSLPPPRMTMVNLPATFLPFVNPLLNL